jgi:alkylated DNA repair dioxygenase AlkB
MDEFMLSPTGFVEHQLEPDIPVFTGRLPPDLLPDSVGFESLWALHPPTQPEVLIDGTLQRAPRWHRAFGHDYQFSGAVVRATVVPQVLQPVLSWARSMIDARLNGILVNWYDGRFRHRIAPHKDSPVGRVAGCPIVTVSFGAERTFQMFVRKRPVAFRVGDGAIVVIPDATNRRFAHSVPHLPGDEGRRISVTLRGFVADGAEEVASGADDAGRART